MNEILLKLEKLGLTSYEAKAYIVLLQKHPANGYEIGRIGKIPSAKVYETLNRMKHKGLLIVDENVEPVQYYPVPVEKLLNSLRQDYGTTIDDLEVRLQQIQPLPDLGLSWNLTTYQSVMDKMTAIIENASKTLMLSIWPAEAGLLRNAIKNAASRSVKICGGVFGPSDLVGKQLINLESCGITSARRLGSRLSVVVADDEEVVISEISEGDATFGVWTSTPGIVLVSKEYIRHDIWGRILIDELGPERFQAIRENNDLLGYLLTER